jgi:hypothetical protein
MRKEYDFQYANRGAVLPTAKGKTRITIRLDNDILKWFRRAVHATGGGNYQTLINQTLRNHIHSRRETEPLETLVRRVVREELRERVTRKSSKSGAAVVGHG